MPRRLSAAASFPADAETSEAVEPGDRALDNPAVNTETGAVRDAAAGKDRFDALSPDQAAVLVVVVAAVAEQDIRASTWSSHESWDRRDLREQGHQLDDIVAVAAGQRHRERDACPSTRMWCLLPGRARSTGLGPLLGLAEQPGHGLGIDPDADYPTIDIPFPPGDAPRMLPSPVSVLGARCSVVDEPAKDCVLLPHQE